MTTLFFATEKALAVIHQRHNEWSVDLQLIETQPVCVAYDPRHQERIYCGTFDQGMWQSVDGGKTWKSINNGLASMQVMSVSVSRVDQIDGAGIVFVGTEPSMMYRSENQGQSWQELTEMKKLPSSSSWSFPPRPWTSHVRWITPDPFVSGRLFVAVEAGALIRSLDGGQTWEDRKPDGPFDTHTLIMHRQVPDRLYSAAGDGFLRPGNGFVQSDDGGETWYRPNDGLQYHYLWSVAADPADPETLVVSASPGPQQAHALNAAESALYRRTHGSSWQQIQNGLPPARGLLTSVLATNEAESGVFYAANNKGIFRSADAGISWEELPISWPTNLHIGRAQALVVSQE